MKINNAADNAGSFYMYNNELIESKDMNDNINNCNNLVYEVIRIINEKPLFFEDHYERMKNSLMMLGVPFKTDEAALREGIIKVVRKNGLTECNVKILTYTETEQNNIIYISKSYYPDKEEIKKGVKTSLFVRERSNPNAKLVNNGYKEAVSKKMQDTGAFELLLVNNEGNMTEGSKSNLFFVKNGIVLTSPDEFILKGVTRKYVFEACRRCGIQVVERLVGIDELKEIEGLFLSGTSIKVLPVGSVDNNIYSSGDNPVIMRIRDSFDAILEEYLEKF